VHLNLGYRWFCRLSLGNDVSDQSTIAVRKFSYPTIAETTIGALPAQARAILRANLLFDLERISDRLFGASEIGVVEAVMGSVDAKQ
jgi:hypothetical protein